nr:hypothetical protein [Tanacetum cinerariifolium]
VKRNQSDTRRNVPVETQRRNVPVETSTSNAFVSQCDGVGSYDWSFQAEEEPTNYALMAFTSSSSSSSNNEVASCSKTCTKAYATLQSHYDKLTNDLRKSQFDVLSYKTGLESVEVICKDCTKIIKKRSKPDKIKHEISKNAQKPDSRTFSVQVIKSEALQKPNGNYESDVSMPASPVYNKYQSGEGYHDVPPPYTRTFMPPKPDLVFNDAPHVTKIVHVAFNVSNSEDESKAEPTLIVPSFVQVIKHVKTPRSSVKTVEHPIPAETYMNDSLKLRKSRNRKACFVCKSFTHLIKDCDYYEKQMVQKLVRNNDLRGNTQHYARKINPQPHRHFVPTAVLTKSRLVPLTAARPVTAAVPKPQVTRPRPIKNVVIKSHSPPRRTINHRTYPKPSTFPQKVTTSKASQHALQDKEVIDSGCSRHMTGNMSYLPDFESICEGCVAFGGNLKGGKITSKGKIKTDTEFIVLSSDFKLLDESHVLLMVPRENNMYNVDLKNIVPLGDLTCVFAKETLDESNLWHRRLGHINFKIMNKLVKDSLLPVPFWAEAVNTVCYVQNMVLVTKPHNKTPYELLHGRTPSIGFIRPFGCPVTILITLDPLGKFEGKVDEGFLVGYSVSSKAFRVFNSITRIVQETLHINFLENKPNVAGSGPTWLFDIDTLIKSMNYQPVIAGTQPNPNAGVQEHFDAKKAGEENVQQYMLFPSWSYRSKDPQNTDDDTTFEFKENEFEVEQPESEVHVSPSSNMPALEDITYSDDEEDVGAEADFTNLETSITVSPIPSTKVHRDHPVSQIIGDLSFSHLTRSMTRMVTDEGRLTQINTDDFYTCMFACFLLQEEPKRVHQALKDPSWIEAMQEELLQFKMQKFWVLVDFPKGKKAIGTKWVFRNKKDERGIVQMDVEDPDYPNKVYKVVKALYGLHQAPKACYETLVNYLLENGFQRGKIDQTLFIKRQKVKRIFRYLKGKPHLGLWYPKDSPINLVAYSDSDYAGASLDRKSTTRGCQFLGCRLISWQ